MLGYKSPIFGLGLFFVLIFNAHGDECSNLYPHACSKGGCKAFVIATSNSICLPVCMWGCTKACKDCIKTMCYKNCTCMSKGFERCCPNCEAMGDDGC